MKNTIKVFGIIAIVAVIGFSMAACGEDEGSTLEYIVRETSGQLIITGIPAEYNGKWVSGGGAKYSDDGLLTLELYAGSSVSFPNGDHFVEVKGVQISGGTATLKVWKYWNESKNSGKNNYHICGDYNGNDLINAFDVNISEGEIFTLPTLGYGTIVNLSFTNGIGSGVFVP